MGNEEFCREVGRIFGVKDEILSAQVIKNTNTGEVRVNITIKASDARIKRLIPIMSLLLKCEEK